MIKKVKIYFSVLLILFIIMLNGCSTQKLSENSNDSIIDSNISQEISENPLTTATQAVLDKSSKKAYKYLITKSYETNQLISYICYRYSGNFDTMLHHLDEKFPVQCIRKFDDSLTYCVYKLEEGGLLFIYFHGNDDIAFANYAFVRKKVLYKKDFEKLNIGDSALDVEAIDSDAMLITHSIRTLLSDKISLHMVKEGFVKITYTTKSTDYNIENYKISNIEFIKNGGEITMSDKVSGKDATYKYYFLPDDYT